MGKDSGKKPKGLLKLNLPLDDTGPKRKRDRRSLLGDGDYNFGSPTEPSEWSKLYLGQPSIFDDTDPAEEYSKTAKADKEKHPAAKSKSFLDDDYGQDLLSMSSWQFPSHLCRQNRNVPL